MNICSLSLCHKIKDYRYEQAGKRLKAGIYILEIILFSLQMLGICLKRILRFHLPNVRKLNPQTCLTFQVHLDMADVVVLIIKKKLKI